jgi:hypothetical protein
VSTLTAMTMWSPARGAAFLGLLALLLFVTTRPKPVRQALRLAVSAPAFLVPAGFATFAVGLLSVFGHGLPLGENPFPVPVASALPAWGALAAVAVALAGQIGLLEAWRAGRRPDAVAFLAGVKRHLLTIGLAKVALAGTGFVLASIARPSGAGLVLYLLPSLLLAPALGSASQYPQRPLHALRAAVRHALRDTTTVGRIVLCQAAFLTGAWFLLVRCAHIGVPLELLSDTSALSYNAFPFAVLPADGLAVTGAVLLSAFASAVFVTAHWLAASDSIEAPVERAVAT